MTLKQYVIIMIFATCLCWVSWGFVVLNINPFETTTVGFLFFYISLFFALLGTLTLAAFGLFHWFSRQQLPMFQYVQKSFRDGFLLSMVLTTLLYLRGRGWLTLWSAGSLVFMAVLYGVYSWSIANQEKKRKELI
jgi:hypothetical protein